MTTDKAFEYCVVFFNTHNVITQIDGKAPASNVTMSDWGELGWDVVQVIPMMTLGAWCAALMKRTHPREG